MAQLDTPAAGGEAVSTEPLAIDPIDAMVDSMLPEEEQEEAPPEAAAAEGEEQPETEGEPEEPVIDPPVSWTAEEKESFKALPRDVQDALSRREAERDKGFQAKATEVARAKQDAERTALAQVAEIERQTVEQLQQLSASLLPQRPDPRLLQGTDEHRAAFYQQQAIFEQAEAQQRELQSAANQRAQRLTAYQQELQRREAADTIQTLQDQFPEYLDPAKAELRNNLASTAAALGYSSEQIAQARAPDILAMRQAADWKAKADKYDALNKSKMETVRAARALPPVARPGTSQPRAQQSAAAKEASFDRFKATKNYGDAADFLEKAGWL